MKNQLSEGADFTPGCNVVRCGPLCGLLKKPSGVLASGVRRPGPLRLAEITPCGGPTFDFFCLKSQFRKILGWGRGRHNVIGKAGLYLRNYPPRLGNLHSEEDWAVNRPEFGDFRP